jgi:glycine dehydrogenase subunit 1
MSGYLPATDVQRDEMLAALGLSHLDALYGHIPDTVKRVEQLDIPEGASELEIRRKMEALAAKNTVFPTLFRGAGAYRHYIPAMVGAVTSREEFVTAYTPYQAEISQGILQSIFEYQTMICELTGMDVSNASVYDGASAAAEAASMCREKKRQTVLISAAAHPDTIQVVTTYTEAAGGKVLLLPVKDGVTDLEALESLLDEESACVYIQSPNFFGLVEDWEKAARLAHDKKAKLIAGCNPFALMLYRSPGECGADIAVGEGQPLGMPLSFGGPYLGFMACTQALTRKLPGRIVGQTTDLDGKRCFVLTLQAREQHIRREKASSNVCSNQAHCALTASVYMATMGEEGMTKVAQQCRTKAHYAAQKISALPGFELVYPGEFFHEFVTLCPISAEELNTRLAENGILGGLPLKGNQILWCCTEMNTKEEIDLLISILGEVAK